MEDRLAAAEARIVELEARVAALEAPLIAMRERRERRAATVSPVTGTAMGARVASGRTGPRATDPAEAGRIESYWRHHRDPQAVRQFDDDGRLT